MIEKLARAGGKVGNAFLDLNHTGSMVVRVSLIIPKFAPELGIETQANFAMGTLAKWR